MALTASLIIRTVAGGMSAATRPSPGDFDGLGFHVRLEFQCDPGQIANQVLIERVEIYVAIESNDGGLASRSIVTISDFIATILLRTSPLS